MQNNDDIDREHYQLRNLPHRQANVQAYGPAPIGQGVAVPIDNNLIPQPDDEEHVLPDNLFPPPALTIILSRCSPSVLHFLQIQDH